MGCFCINPKKSYHSNFKEEENHVLNNNLNDKLSITSLQSHYHEIETECITKDQKDIQECIEPQLFRDELIRKEERGFFFCN